MRTLGLCAVFLVCVTALSSVALAQAYPRWFLFQGEIGSNRVGAGYVQPAFRPDSASMYAFRRGCTAYAMHTHLSIAGGEVFWSTEGGNAWMGSDICVTYDTTAAERAQGEFVMLDTYHDRKKTITLAGDPSIALGEAMKARIPIASVGMPEWVETLPTAPRTVFAVGAAEEYYYETSSWELAERIARLGLARQVGTRVEALMKLDTSEGHDIRHDEFEAELADIRVVARWRDVRKKIFYVLVSMPR